MKEAENAPKYVRREFGYSTFRRSFTLPENFKGTAITAQYINGILHVSVPKAEQAVVKHSIEIK